MYKVCVFKHTNMQEILIVIAPLFLIIFASAVIQHFSNFGDSWEKVLNEYALKIGLPVLIFTALANTSLSFTSESRLILFNSAFLLINFILAAIIGKILRLKKETFRTFFICFAFGNLAYLGIPILIQISGENILPTASILVAIYLFWIFTVGIGYLDYSLEKNKSNVIKNIASNLVKNPLLIAVILGILAGSLHVTLPTIIAKSLGMITASVTPIVLVVIGLFIGKSKIGKIKEWVPILFFSLSTLFMLPAIFYFGVELLGYPTQEFSSSIIDAAMPLAITPFALADKYKLNKEFISRSIVLSTILSAISLPFWISII